MSKIPTFGEKISGINYQTRVGVYIILNNEKSEIALIKAPNGAYFLPGGEIEDNENHMEAISRELLEEMGVSAEIGKFYGQADEYFHSSFRKKYYHNPAFIYEAKSWEKMQEPLEDNNEIDWFPPLMAVKKLKRTSHKWGVKQWLKKH